jgi:hypothetical protein
MQTLKPGDAVPATLFQNIQNTKYKCNDDPRRNLDAATQPKNLVLVRIKTEIIYL